MPNEDTTPRCTHRVRVPGFYRDHQCTRRAVLDGFCTQHHPDTVLTRRAKSYANWNAKHTRMQAPALRAEAIEAAARKVMNCYDNLKCSDPPVRLLELYYAINDLGVALK